MKKIIFLCGCLEPGKDGVGDYVRLLAGALIQLRVEVILIAINDNHTEKLIETEDSQQLIVVRLPAAFDLKERFKRLDAYIDYYNPDWISLQYVVFSFDEKGLPFKFNYCLLNSLRKRKVHVMFHELWVGMDRTASIKFKVWGGLQKILIWMLLNGLKTKVLTTNTNLYKSQLERMSFDTELLPLFGNIPIVQKPVKAGITKDINLVIFGGIHYGAPVGDLAKEVSSYINETQINVVLNFLGRCGSEQDKWIQVWKQFNLSFKVWGSQDEATISTILLNASLGITTTPLCLVQKSGTATAMLEHGLSVLCFAREWIPSEFNALSPTNGVYNFTNGCLKELLLIPRGRVGATVDIVAHQLMNYLKV